MTIIDRQLSSKTRYHIFKGLGSVGRMGNQLWQIASVIGLADRVAESPRFNPNWEYRKYFSLPEEFYDLVPVNAPIKDYPDDYMQRYHDWCHVGQLVHAYYQPSELAIDEMQLYYGEPLVRAPRSLAVHVRLGDYTTMPDLFVQLREEYYDQAIAMALDGSDLEVMVFSDDIRMAKRIIPGADTYVQATGQAYRPEACELHLMALCPRHVIANSTFSWWGAFLADGQRVVYPDQWAHPALELYHRWRQLIPEDRRWLSCPVGNV